tara:strand:+ start:111 stop:383 length:273 start_codon:yes stop_codon:yes gene_type:complete
MSVTKEKIFIDGLFYKPPKEGTPDWIAGSISIKRKELGNFLRGFEEDWLNIDIKKSKSGDKYYCELNTWKPDAKAEPTAKDPFVDSDIPF